MSIPDRFQMKRWSPTRWKIYRMNPGEELRFSIPEYYNAKASVERLNDAFYAEKRWSLSKQGKVIRVRLEKPLTIMNEQQKHFRFAIKEARSLLTMASELLTEAESVCGAPANRDYLKKLTNTCEKLRFDLSKKFSL